MLKRDYASEILKNKNLSRPVIKLNYYQIWNFKPFMKIQTNLLTNNDNNTRANGLHSDVKTLQHSTFQGISMQN